MKGRMNQMQMFSGQGLQAEASKGKESHASVHLAYSNTIKESGELFEREMSGRKLIQRGSQRQDHGGSSWPFQDIWFYSRCHRKQREGQKQ